MMSDDLRTRIAKALQGNADDGYSWEDWLLLADAVIAELGLREEVERQRQYSWNPDRPTLHRYVTDWKADDE